MREFNKFRAITVGIILMFIFAVAAMYSNTKEAAIKKMNSNYMEGIENNRQQPTQQNDNNNVIKTEDNGLNERLQSVTERVENLEKTVFSSKDNDEELKCNIRGIVNDGTIVPLSAEESINEAKINNREIVITCNFY